MRARPSPPTTTKPSDPIEGPATLPTNASVPSALAAQRARNRTIRAHAQSTAQAFGWGTLPLAIVPLQERVLTSVPAAAQQRFLSRLAKRIAHAFTDNATVPDGDRTAPDASPHTSTLLGQACGLCRGACCTRGGDHAFLGEDSLARVRLENPGVDAEALLAQYIAHLPVEHFAESCVYHGATGCALPTRLRSTTCNRYRCGGLNELARGLPSSEAAERVSGAADADERLVPLRLAVVGASDNVRLRRLALFDGTTVDERAVSDSVNDPASDARMTHPDRTSLPASPR